MAYDGEVLDACGVIEIDLSDIEVVAVSGSAPNVCGHLLIHTSSRGGYYFHVTEIHGYPRYMTAAGFARYLKENKKRVLRRFKLTLPNAAGAASYLEQSMSEKRWWGGLPSNCVDFCEDVIQAGGLDWGSYSNCPAIAADVPQHTINDFLNQLESEIRQLYGVP